MSNNKIQMFRRKPANRLQQVQDDKQEITSQMTSKNKILGFTNKICEVNIFPSPTKHSFDQSLAYSISLTPITSSQKKKIQNQKMMQVRKHLYGLQDNFTQELELEDDQSLLLDYKQILDDQKRDKIPITPITNCSNSSAQTQIEQEETKSNQNLCSNFLMFPPEYKLNFYQLNKNTIKVQYVQSKQYNTEKRQKLALILRMRKLFYRQPLLMFDFIISTLQKWNQQVFKIFLVSNGIKFTSEQIKDFNQYITYISPNLNIYQITENLFLLSNQQYQMLLNSQKIKISNLAIHQQNSFLKLYLAMIKQNKTEDLSELLPTIQTFFRKII